MVYSHYIQFHYDHLRQLATPYLYAHCHGDTTDHVNVINDYVQIVSYDLEKNESNLNTYVQLMFIMFQRILIDIFLVRAPFSTIDTKLEHLF